jgi:hypothetical protein
VQTPIDAQIADLLQQFVDGADLLTATTQTQKYAADQPFFEDF